jgi:hypothetical protein
MYPGRHLPFLAHLASLHYSEAFHNSSANYILTSFLPLPLISGGPEKLLIIDYIYFQLIRDVKISHLIVPDGNIDWLLESQDSSRYPGFCSGNKKLCQFPYSLIKRWFNAIASLVNSFNSMAQRPVPPTNSGPLNKEGRQQYGIPTVTRISYQRLFTTMFHYLGLNLPQLDLN